MKHELYSSYETAILEQAKQAEKQGLYTQPFVTLVSHEKRKFGRQRLVVTLSTELWVENLTEYALAHFQRWTAPVFRSPYKAFLEQGTLLAKPQLKIQLSLSETTALDLVLRYVEVQGQMLNRTLFELASLQTLNME
jgi:hypothetical protein